MKKYFCTPLNALYLLIIIILSFAFITVDFKTDYDSSVIKFGIMIVVFSYVVINGFKNIIIKENIKISTLYILAITFTLISDYFLLLKDGSYNIPLTTFIIAHLMYSLIIFYLDNKKSYKWLILEKSIILLVGIIALIITKEVLLFLSIIYALNLIMNTINSIILFAKKKEINNLFLMIGYILFVGCDICVFISNTDQIITPTNDIINMENMAICIIWLFYAPSQYLLGLSVNRGGNNEEENN